MPDFLVEPGADLLVRLDDGDGGTVLVPAKSMSQGNLGDPIDVEPIADQKPVIFGVELTANATLANQAKITQASFTAISTLATTYQAGVASNVPLSFRGWNTAFWNFDAATDKLSITTANVRATGYSEGVPTEPLTLYLKVTDAVGFNVTWSLWARPLGGTFPVLPNIVVGSASNGTTQTLTMTGSLLGFGPGTPLLLRHLVETKGGGLASYALLERWIEFDNP